MSRDRCIGAAAGSTIGPTARGRRPGLPGPNHDPNGRPRPSRDVLLLWPQVRPPRRRRQECIISLRRRGNLRRTAGPLGCHGPPGAKSTPWPARTPIGIPCGRKWAYPRFGSERGLGPPEPGTAIICRLRGSHASAQVRSKGFRAANFPWSTFADRTQDNVLGAMVGIKGSTMAAATATTHAAIGCVV